jgi:hypothetical protein
VNFAGKPERERGSKGKREQQGSQKSYRHGDSKSAEEAARHPGYGDERKKDDDRGNSGKDQRPADLTDGLLHRIHAGVPGLAMDGNVLDHHDGIVDDQPDRRGQAAQGHQVEALARHAEKENGHRYGDRNDQAGDQGRSPIAKKEKQDDARQHQADENRVADTEDAFTHQLRLIVKGLGGELPGAASIAAGHLRGHAVGHRNRIARGLTGDIEQHGGFAVGRDRGVDRHGGGFYGGEVGDADGHSRWVEVFTTRLLSSAALCAWAPIRARIS